MIRMGIAFTTLTSSDWEASKLARSTTHAHRHLVGTIARFKKTEALEYDYSSPDYDGELTYRCKGHMSAFALRALDPRTTPAKDHDTSEPWTINLCRGNETPS